MYSLLLFLFIVNAVLLVCAILMQTDKKGSGGLSSAFGGVGGAASSAFGTRETATFLHKLTISLVAVFFILAVVIGLMSKSEFSSATSNVKSVVMERAKNAPAETLPAVGNTELPVLEKKSVKEEVPAKKETKNEEKKAN